MTEETTALQELESEPTEPVIEQEEEKAPETEENTEETEEKPKPKENRYSKRVKELNTNWRTEQRENERLRKENEELREAKKLKKAPEPDDYEDGEVPEAVKKQWDNQTRESIRAEERAKIKQEEVAKKQQKKWDEGRDAYIKQRPSYLKEDPKFGSYEREIDEAVTEWNAPEIQNIIIESKKLGPEIVKHLGNNPEELLDIASSHRDRRILKMGQLTAKLQAKTVKKTSSAPAPTRSEKGSAKKVSMGANAPYDPKKESFGEYSRRRNGL